MFSRTLLAIVLGIVAVRLTVNEKPAANGGQADAPRVEFALELAPSHGLPGIPPSVKITATNRGSAPVVMPGASFRLQATTPDGKSFIVGCHGDGPCGDYQTASFEGPPRNGAFTLGGEKSRSFLIGTQENHFFYDPRLLQPGRYMIRFRSGFGDLPSNSIAYTVDEPSGDDRVVWTQLVQAVSRADSSDARVFLSSDMEASMAAHPGSTYSKAWAFWRDLAANAGVGAPRDYIQLLQSFLAAGVPESVEVDLKLVQATAYQQSAESSAVKAALDTADAQATQGRVILQALQSSRNSYAAAAATLVLQRGPWSREDLKKYADQVNGVNQPKSQPIVPHVDCVVKNADGTYTAWFGYTNPNDGIFGIGVGTQNHFSPDPEQRGQPTNFLIGQRRRVFGVRLRAHDRLTWSLTTKEATAVVTDDSLDCNDHEGGDH